ncbi:subtilisin-like protein [Sistotremastrum suecicum HHB10207 ss-3]|uniref:tripeptidyl-peptidase II n=1 Tax=Sistotremastrum suecicum HHB10207 ss-3 TaxID=1314776 RepID=A0A166HQR3_9AGAM|nr:subtilisin-like protein [Sistotremastrum suecicum HHB10207 ss-3]
MVALPWSQLVVAVVAACPALVLSSPLLGATKSCAHSVKEQVYHPHGWTIDGAAPPDHILKLQIYLPQPNFHELEQALYQVSDPDHENYGLHLSKEDVESLVAPSSDSLSLVDEWLVSHGLDVSSLSRSPSKDWVSINVPVQKAEEMLRTKYHVWKHIASGSTLIRTTSYSLPTALHRHVDVIQPTTSFARAGPFSTIFRLETEEFEAPPPNAPAIVANGGLKVDAACNTSITITCLQQLYNAVGVKPSAKNGNEIGITGYLGQFASTSDLQLFFANQTPAAVGSSFKFVSVNGGLNNQSSPGVEANLDTQFAFGLSHPAPATFWSTAGSPPFIPDVGTPTDTNEPYTEWLNFILAQKSIPQTISTSYGDDEQTVPLSFAQRVCNGFAQLGARGVSVIFSSGDGGVGDGDANPATQECLTNDGRNATRFAPAFPASCPFVTSVGATFHVPEVSVSFSGGGFSNVFPRPSYQDAAVGTFLRTLPKGKFAGLFNPAGRGIPDVSAQGVNFRIFFNGRQGGVSGTSAASPAFAGIISLVNDARLSKRLPPLGFLNPLIYKLPFAFNDITAGNNPGCGTEGFNATKGWDPISGLGTPDFRKLAEILAL